MVKRNLTHLHLQWNNILQLKDQKFHHCNTIIYEQIFLTRMIWTSQLEKKLRILMKNFFFMVFFLHVQNFMNILPLNLVLLYNCNIVTRLLQSENIFQLLINLFIFAPISWYNDKLGCKPPLIEIFIYNFFSKHPPWYIKVPQVSKIIKL
jgi:hypothetical protein